MENKINSISEDITEIKISIAEIQKDLKYHVLRTDVLEDSVGPLKLHVDHFGFVIRAATWIAGLSGMLGLIARLAGIWRN